MRAGQEACTDRGEVTHAEAIGSGDGVALRLECGLGGHSVMDETPSAPFGP